LPSGTAVWDFLKDRKWHKCQVAEAKQHFVTVRRHAKGPAMALAYEGLRIAPQQQLSIAAEAASLDAPELALASDPPRLITEVLSDDSNFLSAEDRHSEEQRLLQHMQHVVGTRHVSLAYGAALTAAWLVQESFAGELQNWDGAFEIIPYISMPKNANYIRSHAFCKIKIANDDQPDSHLSLKTRIVLHGNEHKE
jgi:hypothetical protein